MQTSDKLRKFVSRYPATPDACVFYLLFLYFFFVSFVSFVVQNPKLELLKEKAAAEF